MVELIDGHGNHYRDVLQELRRDGPGFKNIPFLEERLPAYQHVITTIIGDPDLNVASKFIENARDTRGRPFLVISGPLSLPQPYQELDALPHKGESFVVEVTKEGSATHKELVVVKSASSAERIVSRRMRSSGYRVGSFSLKAERVPPEDFVAVGREIIDAGQGNMIPDFIKRFGGLAEYQRQYDLRMGEKSQ